MGTHLTFPSGRFLVDLDLKILLLQLPQGWYHHVQHTSDPENMRITGALYFFFQTC